MGPLADKLKLTGKRPEACTIKNFTVVIYGRKKFYNTGPWAEFSTLNMVVLVYVNVCREIGSFLRFFWSGGTPVLLACP
jgi:hypothetical protein